MSFSHWLTAVAAALLPLAAAAEPTQNQRDPADAHAAVPAYRYQSSFQQYQATTEEPETPDAVWVSANQALTEQGGHAKHGMQSGQMKDMPAQQDASTKSTDAHAGHHSQHGEGH